jgi:hypothetical protein
VGVISVQLRRQIEAMADLQGNHAIGLKLAYAGLWIASRGGPKFVPGFALARPALALSQMMRRSHSANAPTALVEGIEPC